MGAGRVRAAREALAWVIQRRKPGEVGRLGAAMCLRPLVLACWTFATGRDNLRGVADRWDQQRRRIDAAAEHARAALSA